MNEQVRDMYRAFISRPKWKIVCINGNIRWSDGRSKFNPESHYTCGPMMKYAIKKERKIK